MSHKLKGRDLTIFSLLAKGKTAEQISEELGLSSGTVRHELMKISEMFEVPPYRLRNYLMEIMYSALQEIEYLSDLDYGPDSTDLPGFEVEYFLEEELIRDRGA